MVQNCQNITNPRGYNHGEQLVAKRLTRIAASGNTFVDLSCVWSACKGLEKSRFEFVKVSCLASGKASYPVWDSPRATFLSTHSLPILLLLLLLLILPQLLLPLRTTAFTDTYTASYSYCFVSGVQCLILAIVDY